MASSSSESPPSTNTVQPYRMHVSQKYLDLTRQKLELTRLPRDPRNAQGRFDSGLSKTDVEPIIDHWLEKYDWRAQEAFYNDNLPQFRVPINGTRLHFVHRRSNSPTAVPLLFVHGWPESFISASKMIDALCNPIATPPRGNELTQPFHLVVPSIPGFGFSDPIPEAGNNIQSTAEVFDALMKGLGYTQYILHGTGWGFRICRMIAIAHPESCIAIHTVNPDVPPPRFGKSILTWLKYRIAKLTYAFLRRSSFGYTPGDMAMSTPLSDYSTNLTPGVAPPLSPGKSQSIERPQTIAYALCDSPPGLLACILDAIRPPVLGSTSPARSPEHLRPSAAGKSPISPQSYGTPQAASPQNYGGTPGRSPQTSRRQSPQMMQPLEMSDINNPWTPAAVVNWTMLHWLPGPEVALRWLVNSTPLVSSLWTGYSSVPLAISHFREGPSMNPGLGTGQTPPQWAEAYHRIAMVRRREGRVRFPAWERPAEVVMDLRELADLLGSASSVPMVSAPLEID